MSSEATCPITQTVAGDPRLARLVRMTAAYYFCHQLCRFHKKCWVELYILLKLKKCRI